MVCFDLRYCLCVFVACNCVGVMFVGSWLVFGGLLWWFDLLFVIVLWTWRWVLYFIYYVWVVFDEFILLWLGLLLCLRLFVVFVYCCWLICLFDWWLLIVFDCWLGLRVCDWCCYYADCWDFASGKFRCWFACLRVCLDWIMVFMMWFAV